MTFSSLLPAYYAEQGLPIHGGQQGWVDWISVYGVPVPIPNPPARKRALDHHDAHHMITGYQTDWRGEAEVAAWAYGARGRSTWLALAADGAGFALGILTPRRTARAYLRGRGCRTLYTIERPDLLNSSLEALRTHTGIDRPFTPALKDWAAFALTFAAALALTPLLAGPAFLWGALTE